MTTHDIVGKLWNLDRYVSNDAQIAAHMAEGDQIRYLWKQGFFEGADPE